MADAYSCDACNNYYKPYGFRVKASNVRINAIQIRGNQHTEKICDVCPECMKKIAKMFHVELVDEANSQ